MWMSYSAVYDDVICLELDLVGLYHRFVSEYAWRWSADLHSHFLQLVRNAYCKRTIESGLTYLRFDNAGIMCAYVFLCTPCFSSTVAYHFLNLLRTNPWLVRRTLSRGTLSVCCLGGGPAAELVAVLKVFERVLHREFSCWPLRVKATVVDIDSGWRKIVQWLTLNWWQYFDPSVVRLEVDFLQADLTAESLEEDARKAIGGADLVTMVKFLSSVSGTSDKDKIPDMLQRIIDCIPVGGILFSVNSTRFSCDEALRGVISSSGQMRTVYGSMQYDLHRLSDRAADECYRFYGRYYGLQPPILENKNHVTAWIKSGKS